LARRGETNEARKTLLELRQKYELHPNVVVSAWLSLAEGLLIHFSDMGQQARDKIHRAFALSAAAGLTQIHALSAAWLANMDYLTGNMAGMARFVGMALKLAAPDNRSALSRANLVVAHAYHLASRLDLARPWYRRAHEHATAEGDDATVGALMHNMAWLRYANLRQEMLGGTSPSPNGEHALVSVESTLQFDSLVGATSLQTLAPILRAQILSAKERFAEALEAYEENLAPTLREGMARMHAYLLADQAWCRLNLGQVQIAQVEAREAEALLDPRGHFDDRAATHSRLAQVFRALGDLQSSVRHDDLARIPWDGHLQLQQLTIEVLLPFQSPDSSR
jgi:tetratricopeptide (TPR) repeat protein